MWDQVEYLGGLGDLCIKFGESEQEEVNISYPSCGGSKSFDFSIKGFSRRIGTSVIKIVKDTLMMGFDGSGYRSEHF